MKTKLFLLILAGMVVFGMTAYSHHSFGGTYQLNKEITIEGKMVQFLFRNPHSFVHIEAPGTDGKMTRWAVEWAGGGQLASQGVTRTTLKVGDPVIIRGNPSRTPNEPRIRMVAFKRTTDGLGWGDRPGEVVD